MMIVCLNNINVYKIFGIIIHSPQLGFVCCHEIRGINFISRRWQGYSTLISQGKDDMVWLTKMFDHMT